MKSLSRKDQSLLESYLHHKEYMAAYNKRSDVKEKRRQYNKDRWQQMKRIAAIVKEEGL